jgi:hypothetical protein
MQMIGKRYGAIRTCSTLSARTIVLRQKWSRDQVEVRFASMPPCLIGMETCASENALEQDARLMSAR